MRKDMLWTIPTGMAMTAEVADLIADRDRAFRVYNASQRIYNAAKRAVNADSRNNIRHEEWNEARIAYLAASGVLSAAENKLRGVIVDWENSR